MDRQAENTRAPTILVVEDDPPTRLLLKELLASHGYRVEEADCGAEAFRRVRAESYDLVLTDLRLGDTDGLAVLQEVRSRPDAAEVVLATAYGTIDSAVEAIRQGAFDYLTKPFDTQRVLLTIERAIEHRRMRREIVQLRAEVGQKFGPRSIVARSPAMRRILELIATVAGTDSTVLITGESGTGKELVAHAIHYGGARAGQPFVAVNCTALPEALLESELFGHVKGAFTGALHDKKGLFEEADGGTLLLDEVGDMPPAVQPKLLRALEEGSIRRVGGNLAKRINVRLIAATNLDLRAQVEQGRFREDLFFRLNVIPIHLPPLRDRREDILPLAKHFLGGLQRKLKKEIEGFSPEAAEFLAGLELRGNARELANLLERAVTVSRSPLLGLEDLRFAASPPSLSPAAGKPPAPGREGPALASLDRRLRGEREEAEREHILEALRRNRWNHSQAARELGISRTTLWTKIKRYGLASDP